MVQVKLKFTDGEEIAFEARDPDDLRRRLEGITTAKSEKLMQKLREEIERLQNQTESISKSDDDK